MTRYLLILIFSLLLYPGSTPGRRAPAGLMVEFIRDPQKVRIMDLKPSFSWIVSPQAGCQAAYRILVASTPGKLTETDADTWDSGKTKCSDSSCIRFGGAELKPDVTYYWCVCTYDDSGKQSPYSVIQSFTTGNPAGYQLTPDQLTYTYRQALISKKLKVNRWFFDFGKDGFGTLILKLRTSERDTLLIRLGEKKEAPYSIDRKSGGSIRFSETRLPINPGQSEYILRLNPDSRNTGQAAIRLPDSIGVITPFRYAEIDNAPTGFSQEDVQQRLITVYWDDKASSFTSSDTTLDEIWDLCKYSIKATSFAGIYVDGDRERTPYEADAYINQLGHYYTDREYSMARRTNEYFICHPTWPTEWILHTVPLFYNDFMFTGDIESVSHYYEELKKKTLYMLDRGDGLISSKNSSDSLMKELGFTNVKDRIRDIVDWPPAQKDTGWKLATPEGERDGYEMKDINTVVNAFYYRGLVLMSKLAGYLGKKADSAFFSIKASATWLSFNEKLFDKVKGIYVDGEGSAHSSLHANMTALAFGLVPGDRIKQVTAFIKSRGMTCSVYGAQYLMEALYNAGEDQYALELMTAGDDRSWYNMIRSGSTITMEAWDMKYKPNSDWNHAWGAAPANIIPRFLWGITPAEPGYAKAIIRPQTGDLTYSKIKVPTIRGSIEAEFRDRGGKREYEITIPKNMRCDFIVPGSGKIIHLDGGRNKISTGE